VTVRWKAGEYFQDRYRLLRRLGSITNRQTWLITDESTQQKYVLKGLYFAPDEKVWQDQKLFEREAATLKSIDHPNIPKLHDSFWLEMPEGNYFCLVIEYIPGQSLMELVIQGGSLPLQKVKEIALEILIILEVLHNHAPPVVHRDIKPANLILRSTDQQVCLVDFGSVQAYAAEGRTFTAVGTYGYMAPEQFSGEATPASDLYSLGATLVYLLSGADPADWPREGLKLILDEQIEGNHAFRLWLSQLLEPNSEERFKSASIAQKALQKVEEELQLSQKQIVSPVDKKEYAQLKISSDSLQVKVAPNASKVSYGWLILLFLLGMAIQLAIAVPNLSHLDTYHGEIPLPLYILSQVTLALTFVGPLLLSIRGEKLLFKGNKRQFIVSWGFLLRKCYTFKGDFQVSIGGYDPDPSITLMSGDGRKFFLGKFKEVEAEQFMKELRKWQKGNNF
jgi:serine/threonine protein kinase